MLCGDTGKANESMSGAYRVIPRTIPAGDLVMTHITTNLDRTGFQQDWNVFFPLDRLRECAQEGIIGSVAEYHYSFMGAAHPATMASSAKKLADHLKGDRVDAQPCWCRFATSAHAPWARWDIFWRARASPPPKSA